MTPDQMTPDQMKLVLNCFCSRLKGEFDKAEFKPIWAMTESEIVDTSFRVALLRTDFDLIKSIGSARDNEPLAKAAKNLSDKIILYATPFGERPVLLCRRLILPATANTMRRDVDAAFSVRLWFGPNIFDGRQYAYFDMAVKGARL